MGSSSSRLLPLDSRFRFYKCRTAVSAAAYRVSPVKRLEVKLEKPRWRSWGTDVNLPPGQKKNIIIIIIIIHNYLDGMRECVFKILKKCLYGFDFGTCELDNQTSYRIKPNGLRLQLSMFLKYLKCWAWDCHPRDINEFDLEQPVVAIRIDELLLSKLNFHLLNYSFEYSINEMKNRYTPDSKSISIDLTSNPIWKLIHEFYPQLEIPHRWYSYKSLLRFDPRQTVSFSGIHYSFDLESF